MTLFFGYPRLGYYGRFCFVIGGFKRKAQAFDIWRHRAFWKALHYTLFFYTHMHDRGLSLLRRTWILRWDNCTGYSRTRWGRFIFWVLYTQRASRRLLWSGKAPSLAFVSSSLITGTLQGYGATRKGRCFWYKIWGGHLGGTLWWINTWEEPFTDPRVCVYLGHWVVVLQ